MGGACTLASEHPPAGMVSLGLPASCRKPSRGEGHPSENVLTLMEPPATASFPISLSGFTLVHAAPRWPSFTGSGSERATVIMKHEVQLGSLQEPQGRHGVEAPTPTGLALVTLHPHRGVLTSC